MVQSLALPGLLAVWASLLNHPLASRVPNALGCGAFFGVCFTLGAARNDDAAPDINVLLFIVSLEVLLSAALSFWRLRGWRIQTDGSATGATSSQFALWRMLAWTTGVAVVFGLLGWIVSDLGQVSDGLSNGWQGPAISLCAAFLLTLPLIVPSVGLMLSEHGRARFAFWAIAIASLVAICFCAFFLVLGLATGATCWDALRGALFAAVPMLAGLFVAVLGSLGIVRLAGFRLTITGRSKPLY